jgi:hypothetical protein
VTPRGRKDPAAVALGRRGGQVKSGAKSAASRANGRRGGRPMRPSEADLAAATLIADTYCRAQEHFGVEHACALRDRIAVAIAQARKAPAPAVTP